MCRHQRRVRPCGVRILCAAAITTLIFLSPSVSGGRAQAQGRDPFGGVAGLEARRKQLMTTDVEPSKTSTERRVPFKRMKEDFEQLQLTNNRLYETAHSDSALDYVQVRKDSADIKKRAARLKNDLLLPEPEKDEETKDVGKEFPAEDLKAMVFAMDALVKSFVQNPVFQQPNILDTKLWAKARSDLEGIIRLSEQIQRITAAVSKAVGKKP